MSGFSFVLFIDSKGAICFLSLKAKEAFIHHSCQILPLLFSESVIMVVSIFQLISHHLSIIDCLWSHLCYLLLCAFSYLSTENVALIIFLLRFGKAITIFIHDVHIIWDQFWGQFSRLKTSTYTQINTIIIVAYQALHHEIVSNFNLWSWYLSTEKMKLYTGLTGSSPSSVVLKKDQILKKTNRSQNLIVSNDVPRPRECLVKKLGNRIE